MNNKVKFLRGTSDEYAVAEKDNDTIYFTTDDGKLYIGDKEVSGSDITIDDTLSDTSTNPIQGNVIKQAIDNKADKTTATKDSNGLMSADDKAKLDGIEENANYTVVDSELSETSENAIQNKAVAKAVKGGAELSGSTGYTVTDSVDYPLVGLKVYGKSTQDGTPTPENPVEIVSVGNPTVTVCGKNLSPINVGSSGGGFILETRIELDTETYYFSFNISTSNIVSLGVVYKGNTKYTNDVVVKDFKKVGRVGFAFTPTQKVTKIRIYMSGAGTFTDFQIEKGSTATAYEPYTANTLTLSDTLNAIPVSSGGNVTIDGQEYIADYVDFGEGKYHRLVDTDKLDPTISIVDNLDLLLETEEVTDIPESELQAYRQLQTYNGITNIINDKGAGLSVEYCTNKALSACVTPITTGLQKQIDDLKAAVLSLGGNV